MKRGVILVCIVVIVLLAGASSMSVGAQTLTDAERKELERQYAELEKEIAEWQKVLAETRAKKGTLQGDVTLLNAKIAEAEANIKQKNVAITKLSGEIRQKTARIGALSERIERGKESLASMLLKKSQLEDMSIVELALSSESLSTFFSDIDAFAFIERDMHALFSDIRAARTETEVERAALTERQDRERDARYTVETQKKKIANDEAEKKRLLAITKSQETQYADVLADRQAKAAAIRARLFPLRDTEGIQFGQAVKYAQMASAKTGVRPALILGILKQESDLGNNIGNCYVTNKPSIGDGVGKNTGTPFSGVMHPTRDVPIFNRITAALGKDPAKTPISCPQPGGYGGAMGPTQFIPSTWQLFEPRLKTALGVPATNPWNAEHAIMATALYLADWGAGKGGYTSERNAACAYFSGRACPNTGNWVDTYGSSVVRLAENFQKDIDFLKEN